MWLLWPPHLVLLSLVKHVSCNHSWLSDSWHIHTQIGKTMEGNSSKFETLNTYKEILHRLLPRSSDFQEKSQNSVSILKLSIWDLQFFICLFLKVFIFTIRKEHLRIQITQIKFMTVSIMEYSHTAQYFQNNSCRSQKAHSVCNFWVWMEVEVQWE